MTNYMPIRYGTTIIELARDIMAAVSPTTGERAKGQVLVRSKPGKGTFLLPRNWALLPILNGALRDDLVFKVGQGINAAVYPNGKRAFKVPNEPLAGSWWEITEQGTAVDVHSVVGGARHNLAPGTVFRFDPPHDSLVPEAVLMEGGTVGGADPYWLGGCQSIVQFETVTAHQPGLDLFRSATGKFPSVVVAWESSEPGDGNTSSSLERGATRAGASHQFYKEKFNIYIITQRLDSDHARRNEGLKLLDDVTFWLNDRMDVDGQVFSYPNGVQVHKRTRLAMREEQYQQFYIYLLQVSLTGVWDHYDTRTFADWKRTHLTTLTYDKDADGARVTTTDEMIDMTRNPG